MKNQDLRRAVRMVTTRRYNKIRYEVYEVSMNADDEEGLLVWSEEAEIKRGFGRAVVARRQEQIAQKLHEGRWAPRWCGQCSVALYDLSGMEDTLCFPCAYGEDGTATCNGSECEGMDAASYHSPDCNMVLPRKP